MRSVVLAAGLLCLALPAWASPSLPEYCQPIGGIQVCSNKPLVIEQKRLAYFCVKSGGSLMCFN